MRHSHTQNLKGGEYLLLGLKLMWRPGLRPYVLIPLLINMLFFAGLLVFSIYSFNGFIEWTQGRLPDWLSWLSWLEWLAWLVWLLLAFGAALVAAHFFALLASFFASPFNGLLAERAKTELTGIIEVDNSTFIDAVKDMPRAMKREWHKIKYFLPRALLLLLLYLIPGINLLVPFLWMAFSSWMLGMEYLDYPFDNEKIHFITMKRELALKSLNTLSFGALTMLLFAVPLLNWVLMPAAVIGATAFYVEQIERRPLNLRS